MLNLDHISAPSVTQLTLPDAHLETGGKTIQANLITADGGLLPARATDFGAVMKGALDHVNALQLDADKQRTQYELGLSENLIGTMIASQKASLSFQGVLQVRNRVVSAYETVFNMPV